MDQALKVLAALDPPKRLFREKDVIRETAAVCPALQSRIQMPGANRDKFTIGMAAAFNKIHEAFEATGQVKILEGIDEDFLSETDALLASTPKELDYIFPELPLIMKMMEKAHAAGNKSEAEAGIVLAFVTVARELLDSASLIPPDEPTLMEEDEAIETEEKEGDPTDGSPSASNMDFSLKKNPPYRPDITMIVKNLVDAGLRVDLINLKPMEENGEISFAIRSPFPDKRFDTVAKINALFMKATGRGIQLVSESPIDFLFKI